MTSNFPVNYSASLKIKLIDGVILKKINTHAKGDPENPMTEKEICDKTINLINSNFNKENNGKILIKKIIDSDLNNEHSQLDWFQNLQKIINKKD